jgi:hypothetical protein
LHIKVLCFTDHLTCTNKFIRRLDWTAVSTGTTLLSLIAVRLHLVNQLHILVCCSSRVPPTPFPEVPLEVLPNIQQLPEIVIVLNHNPHLQHANPSRE